MKILDLILSLFKKNSQKDDEFDLHKHSFMPEATKLTKTTKNIKKLSDDELLEKRVERLEKKKLILLKRIKKNSTSLLELSSVLEKYKFDEQLQKVNKMEEQNNVYLRIISRTTVTKSFFPSIYKNAKEFALNIEIMIEKLENNDF